MGRPAKFCREEAVAIAMDAFWTKGYSAVSVSELAEAMAITRSSFYNAFKTREALFDEVLERYRQHDPDLFLQDLTEDEPIVPAIRKALKRICETRGSEPSSRGCMIINCLALVNAGEPIPPKLGKALEAKAASYGRLLKRAVGKGELPEDYDTGAATRAIIIHIMGLNMFSKIANDAEALWQTSNLFLNGIGLRDERPAPSP